MKIGVSYRWIGPRGGKGKPQVYFQSNKNLPDAKLNQLEAFERCKKTFNNYKNCEVWMWEQ